MKNIETRKIIALAMAGALIIFTAYSMITGKNVPVEFITISGGAIAWYFSNRTALDTPKKD